MDFSPPHIPIFLKEILSFFNKTLRVFLDGTVGSGGHAEALLQAHSEIKIFYGIDQDPEALAIAKERLKLFKEKIHLLKGNYRDMRQLISLNADIDGILLDVGVSSMQLDRPEKGFSFSKEGPLDMRMDPEAELDAATIVNTFSERELEHIFREYGEEPRSKRAARAIVEARKKHRILTTSDLCMVLKPVLTWRGRKGKVNPMTLIFQALRIRVNDELGALKEGLSAAIELLAPGGRLGVISFHSLEDRIVKQTFRKAFLDKKVLLLTKKPLVPERDEVRQNPRSRSAKLRFIEKL